MIDLTKCATQELRADSAFVLYRAHCADEGRTLLALVPRQPTIGNLQKLENEFALAADLDPAFAVIPIHLVPHRESMMLVLEDPGGEPLTRILGSPIELGDRLRMAVGLADAVGRLHRRGLLHLDIKPENFLIAEGGHTRLTGFGNAVRRAHQGLANDVIVGTLPYIAPEQTGRMGWPIDSRSDLYALGITLYELFTGALPFSASAPEEWIHCHAVRTPVAPIERVPDLPAQISAIILKLLSKKPGDRYQSAEGLAADLEECLAQWTALQSIRDFVLGRYDAVTAIQSPGALYGRTAENAVLRAAFDNVAKNGQRVVVLISGPSGIGKSSLITKFQADLAAEHALIAAGKFDIQMQGVPYAALTQAFGSLLRQTLTYDEAEVVAWREILTEAVGADTWLITELIPASDLILGRQQPLADLTPQDRLNRVRIVFRRLVGAFARLGRPLILFIDDLQWLDVATLDLIVDLVSRRDVSNLMFIGAYRANEIGPSHPLMAQLEAIRAANVPVEEIALEPLPSGEIARLIAETLKSTRPRVRPLADLVYAKTGGNPFFATQFIKALNEEGLLAYDPQASQWRWDIAQVRTRGITNNVADLLAARLNQLSESARHALQELASIGSAAELESIAIASGRPARELVASMRPALQAGLITRKGSAYAFAHDRVQEAAYEFGPIKNKPGLHLRIGLALAGQAGQGGTNEKVYIVANQLNRGLAAVTRETERETIIAINLCAGRRARTAAAYHAAIAYLKVAQDLLGEQAHPGCGQTAFEIALLMAECELLVGHMGVAEAQLLLLSKNCPSIEVSGEVTRLRANLYMMLGQPKCGVQVCLEFLRQVGIDWRAHPTDREVDEEGARLRKLAEELSDDQLLALPRMKSPDHRATMEVLADFVTPALLTDLNLSNIVIFAAARLTLQHGIYEGSCYPLVCVFSVLNVRYADVGLGLRLAQFGVALADRWPRSKMSGRTYMAFGQFVTPWVLPIRSGQPYIRRSLEVAQANGDWTWASYCHHALLSLRLFSGDSLRDVCKDAEEGLAFAEASGFELLVAHMTAQKDFALILEGRDKESGFEVPAGPIPLEGRSLQNVCFHRLVRIQLNVLAGHYDAALALADDALFRSVRAYAESTEYRFYTALAHAAAHDTSPPDRREAHIGNLRRYHQQFVILCETNPANFADRSALLAAELARIEGRELEAEKLYEEAIRLARTSGFVQVEALAAECAARFYEARGIRTVVVSYLVNARDCYLRWGAHAKARHLERSNPHLPAELVRTVSASADVPLHQLDINALFRASRALSEEIELNRLIRILMQIVVEHAAAERGILFLMVDESPQAVAEARLAAEGIDVTVHETGALEVEFSQSVLNYVVRTRTSLNSNGSANNLLSADPYLRQRRNASLHCLPIVTQTKLVGVLYLESNVSVGAFTPQRAAVLDFLAAQAAISLENARLYADLRRSETFLADGQSISHTGSWSWDAYTGRLLWSDEHYRIFGLAPEAGRAPSAARAFRVIHPEDRVEFGRAVQSSVENCVGFTCEYRVVRSNGTRHLHTVGRPVTDASGKLTSYIGTTIDMSEYKRTQEALQAAQSDLARASRLATIGELSSLIAHEVRQPLSAIVSQAGACRAWLSYDPPDVAKAVAAAARIAGDAHRASSVMESIRQMTRRTAPTWASVDVNDTIMETVALLGGEIQRDHAILKVDLAPGSHLVHGDRVQLQQVVMNLMMNGIEALAAVKDRPRHLWLSTETDMSERISVAVTDVGVGLPAGGIERLFEAFFTTKPGGLGVGLAICRSIIEAHSGVLKASPNDPCGSVFRFTLPLLRVHH